MPNFSYIAKDAAGKDQAGVLAAENASAAARMLAQKALFPVRIAPEAAKGTPVFYGDVEKIFRSHCTDCHQSDGYAPFSLVPYENARRHARMIAEVVDERRMPPWSA